MDERSSLSAPPHLISLSQRATLVVTGHFKMYHPRSNQSVPPRGVGFLVLVGCFWQERVVAFLKGDAKAACRGCSP
jgi:hypothetical protein